MGLITNGGGEADASTGVLATGWLNITNNNLQPATDQFRIGARALKCNNATDITSDNRQVPVLTLNRRYVASGWIRANALSGTGNGASLQVDNRAGGIQTFLFHDTVGDIGLNSSNANDIGISSTGTMDTWQFVRTLFTPLTDDGDGDINFKALLDLQGTVWYDRIMLDLAAHEPPRIGFPAGGPYTTLLEFHPGLCRKRILQHTSQLLASAGGGTLHSLKLTANDPAQIIYDFSGLEFEDNTAITQDATWHGLNTLQDFFAATVDFTQTAFDVFDLQGNRVKVRYDGGLESFQQTGYRGRNSGHIRFRQDFG